MADPELSAESALKKVGIFAWLKEDSIQWLSQRAERLDFQPGDQVHERDTHGDALCIIASGEVNFVSGQGDPNAQTASTLEENDYYGELCLVGNKKRVATARATLPTTLFSIKKEVFEKFSEENPDQYSILITNLARELSHKIRDLNEEKTNSS